MNSTLHTNQKVISSKIACNKAMRLDNEFKPKTLQIIMEEEKERENALKRCIFEKMTLIEGITLQPMTIESRSKELLWRSVANEIML